MGDGTLDHVAMWFQKPISQVSTSTSILRNAWSFRDSAVLTVHAVYRLAAFVGVSFGDYVEIFCLASLVYHRDIARSDVYLASGSTLRVNAVDMEAFLKHCRR